MQEVKEEQKRIKGNMMYLRWSALSATAGASLRRFTPPVLQVKILRSITDTYSDEVR